MGNGTGTVGAGTSYDAATEAIAAAFTTPPTTARKNLIDACVVSLKSAGVWTKLDALYAFAAADSQAAKINWKAPGTFNCTEVNAPAFTADVGFTGNGSTSYLDSGFNPSTAPTPNFTLNSASIFGWSNTAATSTGAMVGVTSGSNHALYSRYTDNNAYSHISTSVGNASVAAVGTGVGFLSASRTGASATTIYKNGAAGTTATDASVSVVGQITFVATNTALWPGQMCAGGVGSQMNATEHLALYNALRTYMTGVGVP
jgi:hypothetical protein